MKNLAISLDMSECQRMIPIVEGAVDSGLLTIEEACDAIADQARFVMDDGSAGKTLGELLAR